MYTHWCGTQSFARLTFCNVSLLNPSINLTVWAASSEFGTYRLCEQRRFRRACASAQSRQNLRYSLIQAVSQEEPSGRKPDPWSLWMAGHAQLKFVMTECSKTQFVGASMATYGHYTQSCFNHFGQCTFSSYETDALSVSSIKEEHSMKCMEITRPLGIKSCASLTGKIAWI